MPLSGIFPAQSFLCRNLFEFSQPFRWLALPFPVRTFEFDCAQRNLTKEKNDF
jgi:hypothetical protein